MTPLYLVDTSAFHRAGHPDVRRRWVELHDRCLLAITPPVRLEVLYSTRSADEWRRTAAHLDDFVPVPCGAEAWARAEDVQGILAERPLRHRAAKLNDLLISAAAELGGATVLHYDEDFDRIAEVTGQPTEWVAPRGSI